MYINVQFNEASCKAHSYKMPANERHKYTCFSKHAFKVIILNNNTVSINIQYFSEWVF